MVVGILFFTAGVLILLYPPLLSVIVACILMFLGISIALSCYYFKKRARSFDNPYMDFFVRD